MWLAKPFRRCFKTSDAGADWGRDPPATRDEHREFGVVDTEILVNVLEEQNKADELKERR
jgi:hypothetical protein